MPRSKPGDGGGGAQAITAPALGLERELLTRLPLGATMSLHVDELSFPAMERIPSGVRSSLRLQVVPLGNTGITNTPGSLVRYTEAL